MYKIDFRDSKGPILYFSSHVEHKEIEKFLGENMHVFEEMLNEPHSCEVTVSKTGETKYVTINGDEDFVQAIVQTIIPLL